MNIIPAIDLQAGQCVRLSQGRFDQVVRYTDSPVKVARQYEADGAKFLHIVDLDGAKNKSMAQIKTILEIREATNLNIQVGGGIRNVTTIKHLLDYGVQKIVLGSIAITDIAFMQAVFAELGSDKFVLAFDVNLIETKEPVIAIHGWQTKTNKTLWNIIDAYHATPVRHILCTDITRDGMLSGPNLALYKEAVSRYPSIAWQASGGVRHANDLKTLSACGVASTIIGKALFEKKITLNNVLHLK